MMATYEQISEMLTKLGPELDVDEIAAYEESRSWAVAASGEGDDNTILLHYDETSGKVFISGECGPVPENKVLSTYEFLLTYNLACLDTGGARTALDRPGGDVSLIYDLPLAELEAEKLGVAITNFIGLLKTMQAMIICGVGDAVARAEEPDTNEIANQMSGAIRA
jgi:hypothetical protein